MKGVALIEVVICIVIGGLLLAMAIPACERARTARPASSTPVESHPHKWGPWSAPNVMSDGWNGTRFTQVRTCGTCGEAEVRFVQVHESR